jgi:sugar lactone lactonase YvrE
MNILFSGRLIWSRWGRLKIDEPKQLLSGLAFPESPRWHEGHVWFAEKRGGRVVKAEADGTSTPVVEVPGQPSGIGWLPDGRLLVVSMSDRSLLRLDAGGLSVAADLSSVTIGRCNDMVVDSLGRAYVGHFGYDLYAGDPPAPASLVLVTPEGEIRVVAEELEFPNGCAITPDARTLVVAESASRRLTAFDIENDGSLVQRRVFADLGDAIPDGICIDAEGAVWVADPPGRQVIRVLEGGRITQRVSTGDRNAVACELGGEDGRTLFICTFPTTAATSGDAAPTGTLEAVVVDVPSGEFQRT